MEGTIAPMQEMVDVAKEFGALTFCDEVHAVGLYGSHGGGVGERDRVMEQIDITTGTLAKGYGVMGGYVAGNAAMIDALRLTASGFIFTTTIPPSLAAGALTSVRHLKESMEERILMHERSETVKRRLVEKGFPLMPSISHIVPLLVADTVLCSLASKMLMEKYDIYIQPINFPTVPEGTERLRITPAPCHSDEDVDYLIDSLCELWDELGLPRTRSCPASILEFNPLSESQYLPKVEYLNREIEQ